MNFLVDGFMVGRRVFQIGEAAREVVVDGLQLLQAAHQQLESFRRFQKSGVAR